MKIKLVLICASLTLIVGCGSSDKETNKIKNKEPLVIKEIDKKSKANFGILSGATINIYELGGESKKLIKTVKTSSGLEIEEIGNFNPYYELLDSKKFYQYELSGGENWDINKDGEVDNKPTENDKVYKRTNKGSKTKVSWWGSKSTGYKSVISD